jgi:hypothetical protein
VYEAPEYLEHWGGFIREFARRYDGNPLLESIDVTYIGPWGEGAGECGMEQCRRFARLWQEAFPNTPRLALIGGEQMRAAMETGAGWRCDCFGDIRDFGSPQVPRHLSWTHHYDCYPQQVFFCGGSEAWKAGPVHFESCWVPMFWYQQGWDIDFILEQGLKFHGTYFMPKYTHLPERWMDKLHAFCRTLGYRFVFRQAIIQTEAPSGEGFRFQCWIENVGVAPLYRPYQFALRLRQGTREAVLPLADVDVRKWLPGDFCLDRTVTLPPGFAPGHVELSAGLIDPKTQQAKVSFANVERYSDRWLDLEGFTIV